MKIVLILLSLAVAAQALCPGNSPCSGHGSCGADDKCTCYRDYSGIDCNSRRCPYTKSWADTTGHSYAECGGKGTCDTKTGRCSCFDGFSGRGCARMNCPAKCNNRGTCELYKRVQVDSAGALTYGGNNEYSAWDADMIQVCKCDPGFEGPSCAKRICPKGNDPITAYDSTGTAEADEVVSITITSQAAQNVADEVVFTYSDHEGNVWNTRPLNVVAMTATSFQEALMSIPNAAVPEVSCTGVTDVITCTFSHSLLGGAQVDRLGIKSVAGCTANGCQPVYAATSATITIAKVGAGGTTENVECSNRGTCDSEVGTCTCQKGYTGEACEIQTIIT